MNKDTIKELKQICPAWGWFIEQGDNMYDSIKSIEFIYKNKNHAFFNTQCCVVGEFWKGDDSYLKKCPKCDDFCSDVLSCQYRNESSKPSYYYFSEDKIKEFIKHVKEFHEDMIKQ